MKIDFYVDLIDNFWDIWFAYNIAKILVEKDENIFIRFFSNNENLFNNISKNKYSDKIKYYNENQKLNLTSNKIIFNFFSKKIDKDYLSKFDFNITIFNFTYFMTHKWCESLHNTIESHKNLTIKHFVPSFYKDTFWVIIWEKKYDFNREELAKRFEINKKYLDKKWVSVFCYPETYAEIKYEIEKQKDVLFFIFDDRNKAEFENSIQMPFLEIQEYYDMMRVFDYNIVRWENTLVSWILANKPFLWDIYKEDNNQHIFKVDEVVEFFNYSFDNIGDYNEILKNFNISEKSINFNHFINYKNTEFFNNLNSYILKNCDMIEKIFKELKNHQD